MTITVDATYEDGVLKPAQPLPLSEHAQVRVTVEEHALKETQASPGPSLGDEIAEMVAALPRDVVDRWPANGASQHDHYLYGAPKRPE
jgi:predicted DNA-binding antitoxin AbrB/MazE fold protein